MQFCLEVWQMRGSPAATLAPMMASSLIHQAGAVIMMTNRIHRRVVLAGAAGIVAGHVVLPTVGHGQGVATNGYVLGVSEGEHLIQRGGNIFIKADPTRGSKGLAMGTQQVLANVGIPIHRHFEMDEAFYVIDGGGTFILDDRPHPIEKGVSIFVPKNAWHGFQNPERELHLLWTVAPSGLEAFFREVATRPGVPPVQRTKDQLNEIARRYGTEFR
jgi:quercetin dioxygenase-like cupin family protein